MTKKEYERRAYEKKQTKQKIDAIKEKLDYLEKHNKNYTKKQYHEILDIQEILDKILKEL